MGIRVHLAAVMGHAKHMLGTKRAGVHASPVSSRADVPKGHLAVYVLGDNDDVGDQCFSRKHDRFVVPISYLNHPLFRDLLRRAEEEYGFRHPMGGLTIPCSKDAFLRMASLLNDPSH